jgi:hypothetical protein
MFLISAYTFSFHLNILCQICFDPSYATVSENYTSRSRCGKLNGFESLKDAPVLNCIGGFGQRVKYWTRTDYFVFRASLTEPVNRSKPLNNRYFYSFMFDSEHRSVTVNMPKPKKISSEFDSARGTEKHRFSMSNQTRPLLVRKRLAGWNESTSRPPPSPITAATAYPGWNWSSSRRNLSPLRRNLSSPRLGHVRAAGSGRRRSRRRRRGWRGLGTGRAGDGRAPAGRWRRGGRAWRQAASGRPGDVLWWLCSEELDGEER